MMTEKDIEQYLVKKVKELKGKAYKFVSPGNVGVPDRLIILKDEMFFVECKRPGGKTSKVQDRQIKKIKDLGAEVFIASSKEEIDRILAERS